MSKVQCPKSDLGERLWTLDFGLTMKVDMHCHTRLSKDSLNDPRRLVQVAAERGLGALCVTDHNGLANALALSRMPDLPIKVIPSEEAKTSGGEIIGYFLSELVPKGLTPEQT